MVKMMYGVSLGPFALNTYKDTVTVFIMYGVHHFLLVYIFVLCLKPLKWRSIPSLRFKEPGLW